MIKITINGNVLKKLDYAIFLYVHAKIKADVGIYFVLSLHEWCLFASSYVFKAIYSLNKTNECIRNFTTNSPALIIKVFSAFTIGFTQTKTCKNARNIDKN